MPVRSPAVKGRVELEETVVEVAGVDVVVGAEVVLVVVAALELQAVTRMASTTTANTARAAGRSTPRR